jgi:hypothetical protein
MRWQNPAPLDLNKEFHVEVLTLKRIKDVHGVVKRTDYTWVIVGAYDDINTAIDRGSLFAKSHHSEGRVCSKDGHILRVGLR